MSELTPERLREIEARVEQAIDGNISSVMLHIEDSEVLLAALKQASEELKTARNLERLAVQSAAECERQLRQQQEGTK